MIIRSDIWTADDHDGCVTLEQTEVGDRGFEKMSILI